MSRADVTDEARQRLLDTWAAWDAKPGAHTPATEMIDASKLVAEQLGISLLVFRDALSAARRAGLDRAQALERVLREHP
jgi:hypothetical protein